MAIVVKTSVAIIRDVEKLLKSQKSTEPADMERVSALVLIFLIFMPGSRDRKNLVGFDSSIDIQSEVSIMDLAFDIDGEHLINQILMDVYF